jgi:hypothetical protein
METTIEIPVQLTPGAVAEIKRLMQEPGFDNSQRLRIGVKGGGCSGMTYVLGFETPTAEDQQFSIEGIPCIMNKSPNCISTGCRWIGRVGLTVGDLHSPIPMPPRPAVAELLLQYNY